MTGSSVNADPTNARTDNGTVKTGLMVAVAAYTLWGLFPIYLKLLTIVPPTETIAHRVLWSVPFAAILLTFRRQWSDVWQAIRDKRTLLFLGVASLSISTNWLIYVWAVVNNQILEASLGYFINPLMYVAAGVFVFKERLRRPQLIAVAIACVGVAILTIGSGTFPWIAISLAALFTAYGYIRKTTNVGALPGLFIEVCLLSPIAFLYLLLLASNGTMIFADGVSNLTLTLMFAGPFTVIPLVLFALAARRLQMTTLGFLQYIGPILQFVIGLAFGEAFTKLHGVTFGLIWISLIIFSLDAVRANRAMPHRQMQASQKNA